MPTRPSLLSYVRSEENPPLTPTPTTADESAANRNKGREGELPQRPAQQRLRQKGSARWLLHLSTVNAQTPAYAKRILLFHFGKSAILALRLPATGGPEGPPILLSPTRQQRNISIIFAHLIFAISHISSDQDASAQQRQSRGNGSQATPSEQLQPLPNLARPVTPTMSCRASLFALHRLLLLLTCPVPRTHPDKAWMATADQAQASAPAYDQSVAQHTNPNQLQDQVHAYKHNLADSAEHTHHQHSALHTHTYRPAPHRQTHLHKASAADESSAPALDTLDSTRPHMQDTRTPPQR
jgi:hypothetical protein